VPLGRQRGCGGGGRTLLLSLNPREGMTKRRMKTRKRGTLPPENLPSLRDLFSRQTRISVGTRRPKRPQVETGPLTGLSLHSGLALVVMGIAHLLKYL
jgi:hypothetical protein